jgi:hypothetical protein
MKKLSKIEIKNKITKYLNNKGIPIILTDSDNLIWNYEPHYSKFLNKIYIDYNNESCYIKYFSDSYPANISRKKTKVTDGFCIKIYRNLMLIKEKCDEIAEKIKISTETKNKYCIELELYYKKLYTNVEIATYVNIDYIRINVNCYNIDYRYAVYYTILYRNNKYNLKNKIQHLEEDIPLCII